ncbi:hypothetical protein [Corynebacterium tapiri]|uniref:hypothetical protein n=1 Tax=Corynebacterium tapiri TaxID=1448266 RepID=UPI0026D5AFBA
MKKFSIGLALASALTAGLVSPAQAEEAPAHDLQPTISVSGAKAPGFSGLVAVKAKNVGTERYYADFPAITFRIEVKTDKGPEHVDRLITPGWFNGAYTRDLGFNKETSTRTFETTLSNPVNVGEEQLIANLHFGDGDTREGRLYNYITVTQVGRLEDDKTEANDQNVDSRTEGVTVNDFGNPVRTKGIF